MLNLSWHSTIAIMGYRFTTLESYNVGQNATSELNNPLNKPIIICSDSQLIRHAVDGIGVTLWSGLELDVALICACMPSVYPLFLLIIHRGRPAPPSRSVKNSSLVTIGGKPSGRARKRGLWSVTGLTRTDAGDEFTNTGESGTDHISSDLSEEA
jgi:hypothetical protein